MADFSGDRLLPGEDPETNELEDVELWLQVYGELIAVSDDLIARLNGHLRRVSEPAQAELDSVEQRTMEEQAARFGRRFDFWQSRRLELEMESTGFAKEA